MSSSLVAHARTLPSSAVTPLGTVTRIGLILLASCGPAAPVAPARAAEIILPIEVLGPTDTTRTVTVTSSAPATALSLRIHGLAHAGTGAVRVDDGAWIPLTNTTATTTGLAARMGGIGMFMTLDLRVQLPGSIPAGPHHISFKFAEGDGVTIGFRVLRLNLLDQNGGPTIAENSFRSDDPATWTPPRAGAAERDAGEALWRGAQLVEGNGGPKINARCSDCHAQDGRDLSYFNYSNHSIIERSKFHGLSPVEAEQIASYIRRLPGSVNGRPWNPPYQPGPGLTSRPVSEWAAGAGIDAVAIEDADTMAYVPGASGNAREIIDEDGHIRDVPIHDLPMAFQLLDWNHWLPRVHPLDVPGYDFNASTAKAEYESVRAKLSAPDGMDYFENQFGRNEGTGNGENTTFNKLRDAWSIMRVAVEPGADISLGDRIATPTQANHIYSAAVWGTVKLWELMQEFDLEGRGKISYGATAPERQWYSNRFIFDSSPFLNNLQERTILFGDGPEAVNYDYINNSWYELQMQLNAGKGGRSSGGHGVIDWTYMSNHFGGMRNALGEGEPIRRTIFALMSMQQREADVSLNHDHDGKNGFPETDGWDYTGTATALVDFSSDYWRLVSNPKPLIQALLQVNAEKQARFTHEEWHAVAGSDDEGLPFADYIIGTAHNPDVNYAEFYVRALNDARDTHRIDEPVINGMAAVGKLIWANNSWNVYRSATATVAAPATCTATSGVGSIQISWAAVPGATSYNLYRSDSASAWFAPIQLLTTATSATDRRLPPGSTWYYYVTANNGDKEANSHSPIASASVARGLVARWAFDESGQKILDASGLRNHGELIGAIQRIPGRHGGALRITAKGQFASVTYNLVPSLVGGATVTAWVRSSATLGQLDVMTVMGSSYWFGKVDSDGKPRVRGDLGEVTGTSSVLDGEWHHLAMSHAADGQAKVWVDGVLDGSGQTPVENGGDGIHDLGRGVRFNGGDTTWIGDLDDIRIYDQILGESEIHTVMNDDSTGPGE